MTSLIYQSYGKSRVRVSRVRREGDRHDFQEITVSVMLHGDFEDAYTEGDNRQVVPTDTMKNTVYALAHKSGMVSIEAFGQEVANHFLESFDQVDAAEVDIAEKLWQRMEFNGTGHDHSFVSQGVEQNHCEVVCTREAVSLMSGLEGLQVLKTTGSGFSGFVKDQYTTLAETDDRIFATTIDASWACTQLDHDWPAARQAIRAAVLDVFADTFSASVQETLYKMASAAFAVCPQIDEISISMPNQHHLLANLQPLGLDNPNEIFVPVDEPHGMIQATLRRDEEPGS